MALFPKLPPGMDGKSLAETVKVQGDYIAYMVEQMEFSFSQMKKTQADLEKRVKALEDLHGEA